MAERRLPTQGVGATGGFEFIPPTADHLIRWIPVSDLTEPESLTSMRRLVKPPALRIPGAESPSLGTKVTARVFKVYFGTDDAFRAVQALLGVQLLVTWLGADQYELVDVKPGSVLLRIKAWSRRFAQKREVRVLATQLMSTAEAMTVEKAQAENTANHVNSLAALVTALKDAGSFSGDFGSLQYVQYQDENGKVHAQARTLSSKEMAQNRLSDRQLSDPQALYEILKAKEAPPE